MYVLYIHSVGLPWGFHDKRGASTVFPIGKRARVQHSFHRAPGDIDRHLGVNRARRAEARATIISAGDQNRHLPIPRAAASGEGRGELATKLPLHLLKVVGVQDWEAFVLVT